MTTMPQPDQLRDLGDLRDRLRQFATDRDWDQFHTPKNLAMALVAEAGELLAEFQWVTPEQSSNLESAKLAAVRMELADVLIYLVRLADRLDVDLLQATAEKLVHNSQKYPAAKVRGSANKYTEYK